MEHYDLFFPKKFESFKERLKGLALYKKKDFNPKVIRIVANNNNNKNVTAMIHPKDSERFNEYDRNSIVDLISFILAAFEWKYVKELWQTWDLVLV